jgi:S-layer homology domain
MTKSTQATKVLSSEWGGLNPLLIARFYPVERVVAPDGKSERWQRVPGSPEVHAPMQDMSMEHTANWNSPFENTGVDQKFSSVSALLQAGALMPLWNQLKQALDEKGVGTGSLPEVGNLEGRTSVTKLNSRQIYNGTPPFRITGTAHFRAFQDAAAEVEEPVNQLVSWQLPQKLAQEGIVTGGLNGTFNPNDPALYPSKVPQIIGLRFSDMEFMPVVIESCTYPIGGPRTPQGHLIEAPVQLTIASLTAIDKDDWATITTRTR